jgi:hypothetical protein
MNITRTLQTDVPDSLAAICKTMGFVRADIWRRYGALQNIGSSAADIRKEITAGAYYANLAVDGTIRAETTKDVVNDILTYKEAALALVRKSVAARTQDKAERKRYYTLLRKDEWLQDNFLHRQMRKHFRHGRSHTANQFIVRSDKYSSQIIDGRLIVTIRVARKFGDDIRLVTTSSGKNVNLSGCNLRIIVRDGHTEIHYATEKAPGRAHGNQVLGVDKGYTEAFTDSDGKAHGQAFGAVLTRYSDTVAATGVQRNRLHALEKKHRAAGNIAKADRILKNNLGRKKIDARRERTQRHLRTIAFQAAHSIVDKAEIVGSEDLTSPIAKKQAWKRYNRRMSSWAKGALADALDSVCTQRDARHVLVNGAYTSQMDSTNGLLEGRRIGDKFYRENGDVIQADYNAALNVKARLDDREISRFTPYKVVRQILLSRSPAQLSVNRLELGERPQKRGRKRQPSADKSNAQLCAS